MFPDSDPLPIADGKPMCAECAAKQVTCSNTARESAACDAVSRKNHKERLCDNKE